MPALANDTTAKTNSTIELHPHGSFRAGHAALIKFVGFRMVSPKKAWSLGRGASVPRSSMCASHGAERHDWRDLTGVVSGR